MIVVVDADGEEDGRLLCHRIPRNSGRAGSRDFVNVSAPDEGKDAFNQDYCPAITRSDGRATKRVIDAGRWRCGRDPLGVTTGVTAEAPGFEPGMGGYSKPH